jgi:two-component system, probable response regulator PhcQ
MATESLGRPDWPQVVLVVDDEEDIAQAITATLEAYMENVKVLIATSGPAALEILEQHSVDLILTDFRMPGMDGMEFLAQARKVAPKAARMMITAYPDLDLAIDALNQERVVNFISKPVDSQELVDVVQAALDQKRGTIDQSKALATALARARRLRNQAPSS